MSTLSVGPPADRDEIHAFVPVHQRTYLMSSDQAAAWAGWVTVEDMRICRRDGRAVGGMHLVPMGQWFGGRSVPMVGISAVGVEPAERARGTGSAFMAEVLRELHDKGVALSTLYAATHKVYQRCGYAFAGDNLRYRVDTDHADVRERSLTVELTTDDSAIKRVYDERSRRTAGVLDRSDRFWGRVFDPYQRGSADRYLIIGDDGPEGYVLYTREQGGASGRTRMNADVVALTTAAARRVVTFIADHRSFVETFDWMGPPADPIAFQLGEPRRRVTVSFPWMLRMVDVRAALAARGYRDAVEAELHLDVVDDVLPGNAGRLVLRVSGGKAEIEPGGEGRIRIDVRGLATLYTGYASARELVSLGGIEGAREDLDVADAVFAGPAPWLADTF